MNASSTEYIDERDLAPWNTDCPPWCTVGEPGNPHVRHVEFEAEPERGWPQVRVHDGPRFGAVHMTGREVHGGAVTLGWSTLPADIHDLRTLAADAQAAAEWLEAHR